MPGPYSQDLRDRVASAIAGGSSACAAAKRFRISESTAVRWAQRLSAEGHAEARAMGGDRRSRLTGHRATVLTLIAHQPDLTLAEIRAELAERHGICVGLGTVWRFLAAQGITLKNSRGSVFPPVAIETAGVMIGAGEERPTTFWWNRSP